MRALGITRREAIGIIESINCYCIDHRPGGVIEKALIAEAVEWEKDPAPLIAALMDEEALKIGLAPLMDVVKDSKGSVLKDRLFVHAWPTITKNFRKSKDDYRRRMEKSGKPVPPHEPEPPPHVKSIKDALESVGGAVEAEPTSAGTTTEEVDYSPPDRSSSPEALAADAYLRINPDIMSRAKVIAKIRSAKDAYGAPMEKILEACSSESHARGVEIWDLLEPLKTKEPARKPRLSNEEAAARAQAMLDKQRASAEARRRVV